MGCVSKTFGTCSLLVVNILRPIAKKVYVLARIRNRVPYMSHPYCVVTFQRDTQQENPDINTSSLNVPVTAKLGRVNEALCLVMLICCYYELRHNPRLQEGMKGNVA